MVLNVTRTINNFGNTRSLSRVTAEIPVCVIIEDISSFYIMRALNINGVKFANFIAPGLIMMTILQNSFANAASSIGQSKFQCKKFFCSDFFVLDQSVDFLQAYDDQFSKEN